MEKNMIEINKTTRISIDDDGIISIHQLDWKGKDYTTIHLSKEALKQITEIVEKV
jgi:hypothetical protein